jgi:polysaccharide export outer membrane protein
MVSETMGARPSRGVALLGGLVWILLLTSPIVLAVQEPSAGAGQQPAKDAPDAAATASAPGGSEAGYTVSPEDLLDITVLDVPEISRTYRVGANGLLSLPLLTEPINAAGETLDQLARVIAAKFRDAGMLSSAQVSVSLKETRLHTVLISGEVRRPQSYTVYGPTSLLDLLSEAGGLGDGAGNEAIITRGEAGKRATQAVGAQATDGSPSSKDSSFTVNVRNLLQTADEEANVLLYPGDRVVVPKAPLVYVMGAVVRPGGYVLNESRQQMTVLKALAMAGDVTTTAKKSHITLLRRDPSGAPEKRLQIPLNYKAMVKGQVADLSLKPDDIVFVPDSLGLKALHATAQGVVQSVAMSASALVIYH